MSHAFKKKVFAVDDLYVKEFDNIGINSTIMLPFSIMQELQRNNVTTVVRVCEPSYKIDLLQNAGIEVRDLAYDDGTFPPQNIVDEWFELLKQK